MPDTVFLSVEPEGTDSIITVRDTSIPQKVISVLEGSELITQNIDPQPRVQFNQDWITIHLVVMLSLITWARVFYRKRFSQLIRAYFGQHYQGILLREGNVFRERVSIPLLLNYLVTFSIFIYLFIDHFIQPETFGYERFKLFALIIMVFLLTWIIKNVFILFTGFLFRNPVVLNDYILTQFIFNVNNGIFMFPVVIFATYVSSSEALYAGLFIWIISFIYRVFRQLFTGIGYRKFSLFNRILYLCTFEIAPILVLIKLILNNLK